MRKVNSKTLTEESLHRSSQSNPTKDVASIHQEEPHVFISLNRATRKCTRASENPCKKRNHLSAICRQKVAHSIDPPDTDDDNESDISGEFYTDTVNSQTRSSDPAYVDLARNDNTLTFKVDTGVQVKSYPRLKRSKVTLHGYGGHKLSNLGVCELECSHNGAIHNLQFHVVDVRAPRILGLKSRVDMKLVKLILSVGNSGVTQIVSSTVMT